MTFALICVRSLRASPRERAHDAAVPHVPVLVILTGLVRKILGFQSSARVWGLGCRALNSKPQTLNPKPQGTQQDTTICRSDSRESGVLSPLAGFENRPRV